MELIILYLPLFILIYSFYSLPINPGFPVKKLRLSFVNTKQITFTELSKAAAKVKDYFQL